MPMAVKHSRQHSVSTSGVDRKSTRLNSSHTEIYTLSLHDALPIYPALLDRFSLKSLFEALSDAYGGEALAPALGLDQRGRSEEHTSELQSHRDLHSFPTRRSSDLPRAARPFLAEVAV